MKKTDKNTGSVNIYEYLDYREYLRDLYEEKKQTSRGFSYRSFCRRAGIVNVSYLKLVMEGKRNLTNSSIVKFSKGLNLKRHESVFFENLVHFNQADSHEEKDHYYRKIVNSKRFTKFKQIDRDQYEYFSCWYYAVVRELVSLPDFKNDPAWIAAKLKPAVSPKDAAEAIELLLKLELIGLGEDGRLYQKEHHITTHPEATTLVVYNFQHEMMKRAMEANECVKARNRDISTLTIATTKERFAEAKKRINEFRRQIYAYLSECDDPETVYQLNLQFFPLSEVKSEA